MFPSDLIQDAQKLYELCRRRNHLIATAEESCTGGLLAALLTEVPGSSKIFDRGFITYSNDAKSELLGISNELIELHGAVSAEIAMAMAEAALGRSSASIAASITGIAGPGGGTDVKPVGLVFLACVGKGMAPEHSRLDLGNRPRQAIRLAAVAEAMRLVRLQAEA
jgi:nicotinamide-nucleotide amidase